MDFAVLAGLLAVCSLGYAMSCISFKWGLAITFAVASIYLTIELVRRAVVWVFL